MTALWICPAALPSSEHRQEFLSSLFRLYSCAFRGLKRTFSEVNTIFGTLILFSRVVSELLPIPHVDFHHNVAHRFILPVITAKRKRDFCSLPFPCLHTHLHLMLLQFKCDVSTLTLPEWTSFFNFIYTFKKRYDNILIIPKIYLYLLTTFPLTHKLLITSRRDHYLNMWLELLSVSIHNYRVSIILCQ